MTCENTVSYFSGHADCGKVKNINGRKSHMLDIYEGDPEVCADCGKPVIMECIRRDYKFEDGPPRERMTE